jgi:hypothetical protein
MGGATELVVPMTPTRLADTRPGWTAPDGRFTGTGPVAGGHTLEVPIAGRFGIPTNAPAAIINATIVGPQADGYATIYPCGTIPEASSLNYRTGVDIPNEIIAKLSPTGTICIYTYATTNLIIDAVGHVS